MGERERQNPVRLILIAIVTAAVAIVVLKWWFNNSSPVRDFDREMDRMDRLNSDR